MSKISVVYPALVTRYQVEIGKEKSTITLEGKESAPGGTGKFAPEVFAIGEIVFGDLTPVGDHDFIARGGALLMEGPISLLSGVLVVLRSGRQVVLSGDGTLSTKSQRVGADKATK
jgi:hypothetical protein